LWKSKHIAFTSLLTNFLSAQRSGAKLASLVGMWQLYAKTTPSQNVKDTLANNLHLIIDAGEWVDDTIAKFRGEERPERPNRQATLSAEVRELFDDHTLEPAFLDRNKGLFSLAAAAVALVGIFVPAGLSMSEKKTLSANIVDLGKSITAKNVIMKEVVETKETLLSLLWAAFGQDYIPSRDVAAKAVQEKSLQLLKDLTEYETKLKIDFFGVMREEPIIKLEKAIRNVESMYHDLSAVQKSQYNLTMVLQQIKAGYENLLERRNSLIVNVTGKQKPVVIHIVGSVGLGKTVYARNLVDRLSKKFNITSFWRSIKDEFWSNFAGQQILVWDDIGTRKDGMDYDEFCYHTETAPSTSIGAAIKDKGRPTNPLFIITTGNVKYLGAQHHNMVTPDAYHRRRHLVVQLDNLGARECLDSTGETQKSWEYDSALTTFTLYRPVPLAGTEDAPNKIGGTTEDRIFEYLCAMKTINDNEFKDSLRRKEYFKNEIPENEVEDRTRASIPYLLGKVIERKTPSVAGSDSSEDFIIKETKVECTNYKAVFTPSEGMNRCYINAVLHNAAPGTKSETVKKQLKTGPTWFPSTRIDEFVAEQYKIFNSNEMGDNYSVANVAAHFSKNVCIHHLTGCTLYDMGFSETVHVKHDREAQHYEAMEQVQVQGGINPSTKVLKTKRPIIVVSGPSGCGKTHTAQKFAQLLNAPVEDVYLGDVTDIREALRANADKVMFIDDITMSNENYEQAVAIANAYYSLDCVKPVALIMTENSKKLGIVKSKTAITELHRRSHLIQMGFNRGWFEMDLFIDDEWRARRFRNELSMYTDCHEVQRSRLWASFVPYEGTLTSVSPVDLPVQMKILNDMKFHDEVETQTAWSLPLPNEIDFGVELKMPIAELCKSSTADLVCSVFTGKLYTLKDYTNKFSAASSLKIVKDIFATGPRLEMHTAEELVLAFNNCNVKSKFDVPGCAVIRGPDGNIGICWRGETIRMFTISCDNVTLKENKIDVEAYFNAASIYRDLISEMTFDPNTITDVEQSFKDLSLKEFKEKHVLSTLFNVVIAMLSIGMQIYAPYALAREMMDRGNDAMELAYLRKVCPELSAWNRNPSLDFEPFAIEGRMMRTLEEVEDHVGLGRTLPMNVIPKMAAMLVHIPYGYPCLRQFLSRNPIAMHPQVEQYNARHVHFPPNSYTRSNHVIEAGSMTSKSSSSSSGMSSFFDSKHPREYDSEGHFHQYAMPNYDDKINQLDDLNADWDDTDGEVDYDERIEWESAQGFLAGFVIESSAHTNKRVENTVKLLTESSAHSKPKAVDKPLTVESSAHSNKTIRKAVSVESFQNGSVFLYTNKDGNMDIVKSLTCPPGFDSYYAFVDQHGYYGFEGRVASIKCSLYTYVKTNQLKWAVMFIRRDLTSFDAVSLLHVESATVFEAGDVVMVRRTLLGNTYEHYGIVGPEPNGDGLAVYHVQSAKNASLSGIVAVDPIQCEKWILANRDDFLAEEKLRVRSSFDHLKKFAFTPFPYHIDASNCETWALAMRYENWQVLRKQKPPTWFNTFLSIAKTFTTPASSFPEIPKVEASIDPTGLNFNRSSILPASVVLVDPATQIPLVRGLGVKGNFVLSVAHSVDHVLVKKLIAGGTQLYPARKVWSDVQADVALYEIVDKKHQAFRDITGNFLSVKELTTALADGTDQVALLTIPTPVMNSLVMQTYSARIKGQIHALRNGKFGEHGLEYSSYLVGALADSAYTQEGDCGSALSLLSPHVSGKIIGVHRAATKTRMYASVITKEKLLTVVARLAVTREGPPLQCWTPRDGVVAAEGNCPVTGFPIVGKSIYPPNPNRGTKLRKVMQAPRCIESEGEPAILAARDPRANGYMPVYTTLKAFERPEINIDEDELAETTQSLVQYFATCLTGKKLEVLTLTESLNGPSRMKYPVAGSLERSSSPGFPLTFRDKTSNKNAYLVQKDIAGQPLWQIADNEEGEELKKDIDIMSAVVGRGKRPNLVFSYFPKDEVLPMRKITEPKTRGILASNMPYVILFRRYFLALHLRFQEMFRDLPIKIGIDCLSSDWNDLANYHLKVGSHGFDADAKSWDASVPVVFMKMALNFCNGMYQKLDPNWTAHDDTIRTAIHACTEKPYVLVGTDVLQLPQGQVSGQPGTAFENSFVNILLVVQCFINIMKLHNPHIASVSGFFKHVALSVYGDDMMVTLSAEVVEVFTIDKYAIEAAKYGFTITNAQKTADIAVKAIPLEELVFLKRHFVNIRGQWAGPIELASIGKSVTFIRGSGSYFPKRDELGNIQWRVSLDLGLIRANFESALRELSLHSEDLFYTYLEEVNRALIDEDETPISAEFRGIQKIVGIF